MKKFAVFDIDGTLIRWQLYHNLVDKLAKSGALGENATRLLHEARMSWKRRETTEGFAAYEQKLIKIYEQSLTNVTQAVFDKVTQHVVEEYQDQVYVYTRELIKSLKAKGYVLLAISGSHHELVGPVAKHYGFDDYAGSQYERTTDGFSGKVFVASHDKASILKELVKKHGLSFADSYGIGDSKSDATMLALVDNPIAFNPDQNLFQVAKAKGWKIVLERKNMIYELEAKNDTYILAKTGE